MRGGGADVVRMTLKQRKRAKQLAMLEELERGAEEARQREAEVAVLMEKRAARTRDRKERLLLRIAAVVRLQTISRGMRTRRKKKIEWAPKRIQRTWRYYHFMRVVKQYAAQRGRSAEKIQMPFKKRRAAKRSKAATALQSRARGRQTKSRTQRAIKLQRVRHRASAHILQAAIREHQDIVQKRKARPWQKHATLKERRDNPAKYYDVGKERRDSGHSDEHRARRPSHASRRPSQSDGSQHDADDASAAPPSERDILVRERFQESLRRQNLTANLGDAVSPISPGNLALALSAAVVAGHTEQVDKLLSGPGKERVDEKDGIGATPLMHAAWGGDEDTVARLLEEGGDANLCTAKANTALHFAFAREHSYVVHLLMSAGARSSANDAGNFPHNCNPLLAPAEAEAEGGAAPVSVAQRLLGEELGTVVFARRQFVPRKRRSLVERRNPGEGGSLSHAGTGVDAEEHGEGEETPESPTRSPGSEAASQRGRSHSVARRGSTSASRSPSQSQSQSQSRSPSKPPSKRRSSVELGLETGSNQWAPVWKKAANASGKNITAEESTEAKMSWRLAVRKKAAKRALKEKRLAAEAAAKEIVAAEEKAARIAVEAEKQSKLKKKRLKAARLKKKREAEAAAQESKEAEEAARERKRILAETKVRHEKALARAMKEKRKLTEEAQKKKIADAEAKRFADHAKCVFSFLHLRSNVLLSLQGARAMLTSPSLYNRSPACSCLLNVRRV